MSDNFHLVPEQHHIDCASRDYPAPGDIAKPCNCKEPGFSQVSATDAEALEAALNSDSVNHPAHYGGDTPYEVIKVLGAWGLLKNFCLANVVKYVARAEHKGAELDDLKKARWYLDYEIKRREQA